MPSDRRMTKIHLVAPGYFKHNVREDVPSDRLMVTFESGDSEIFDFELDDEVKR